MMPRLYILFLILTTSLFAAAQPSSFTITVKDTAVESLWLNVFTSQAQMDASLYRVGKTYKITQVQVNCDSIIRLSVGVLGQYNFEYQFRCGDHVDIYNGDDNMPLFKVANRPVRDVELNYSYYNMQFFRQQRLSRPAGTADIKRNGTLNLVLLDSLRKLHLISDSFYTAKKQNLPYLINNNILRWRNAPTPMDSMIPVPLFTDSLMTYTAYPEFLDTYIQVNKLSPPGNKKAVPAKRLFDYVAANLTGEVREALLFKYLRRIYFESKDSLNQYLTRFKSIARDPYRKTFYDDILRAEKADKAFAASIAGSSGLLQPIVKGNKVSFANLLKQYKGKVIYIDFWASWCTPCRANMPASHVMTKQLADKPFVSLYISLDKSYTAWQKGCTDLDLTDNRSFLLLDAHKSPLVKTFTLDMIPKYILIDKGGNIVNKNAPRPGTPELEQAISKLLGK